MGLERALVSPPSYAFFDRENIIERIRGQWILCVYRCGMYHLNKKSWLGLISGRHEGRKKRLTNDMHSSKLNFKRNRERRKTSSKKTTTRTCTGTALFRADYDWLGRRRGVTFLNSEYT